MVGNEEASPICRGKNLSWETIMLFFNYMPKSPMPKDQFNSCVEENISSWVQTHSQIARQLAFYYEENGICYPRFDDSSTLADLFAYMVRWAHNYFIPNPFTPSLKGNSPKIIYSHLLDCIAQGVVDFDEALDSIFNIPLSSHDKVRVYLQNYTNIKFDNGIISLHPSLVDKSNVNVPTELEAVDAKAYFNFFSSEECVCSRKQVVLDSLHSYQQIFYGAPGTGKSYTINLSTRREAVIRTTFHPDTDYSTFVGAYKPTTIDETVMTVIGTKAVPVEDENGNQRMETKIVYEFVSQSFMQAYVAAWKRYAEAEDVAQKQFLVIEEINRGNCAQIFGDLFQLLDRNEQGFSDYPIQADADMRRQLKKAFEGLTLAHKDSLNLMYDGRDVANEVMEGEILLLPNNFYIWATMNTSDQSLFPIDSAFKRRWDWKYMPISDAHKAWCIEANGQRYDWWRFLELINEKIGGMTHSEDKKLGYFFCKAQDGVISAEKFVGKVIFYLWNDVFKDYDFADEIFRDVDDESLTFDKFYTKTGCEARIVEDKVCYFLEKLGVVPIDVNMVETAADVIIKVNGKQVKYINEIPFRAIEEYIQANPSYSADEVYDVWSSFKQYSAASWLICDKTEHDSMAPRYANYSYQIECADGESIWVNKNGWMHQSGNPQLRDTIQEFIDAVNSANLGVHITEEYV